MSDVYQVLVGEADRIRAGLALQLVAAVTGVPVEAMQGGTRISGPACRARWLALYLAHIGFGWPLERVGHAFGLNRTTVATACAWVEDHRDAADLDALLARLEDCIRTVFAGPPCRLPR